MCTCHCVVCTCHCVVCTCHCVVIQPKPRQEWLRNNHQTKVMCACLFLLVCGWLVCLIHLWYFIAKRTSTDALSFCSAKLFALYRIYPLLLFINFRIFCIHQRKSRLKFLEYDRVLNSWHVIQHTAWLVMPCHVTGEAEAWLVPCGARCAPHVVPAITWRITRFVHRHT